MKHTVALSGSYSGGDVEKLFNSLSCKGITQMSLLGREITLQVCSSDVEGVKKHLQSLGVNNINILEWRRSGVTLSGSGRGVDNSKLVNVSLIPSTLEEGIKSLAFLCECDVDEEVLRDLGRRVEEILKDAGVTDALYTVHIKKKAFKCIDRLEDAVTGATLNALFDAGGVVNID